MFTENVYKGNYVFLKILLFICLRRYFLQLVGVKRKSRPAGLRGASLFYVYQWTKKTNPSYDEKNML
jgi:hypothetical protein